MLLSLLSDTFISDSIDDAGRPVQDKPYRRAVPLHFPALCRGLAVLVALALPIILTVMGTMAPVDTDVGFDTPPVARVIAGAAER